MRRGFLALGRRAGACVIWACRRFFAAAGGRLYWEKITVENHKYTFFRFLYGYSRAGKTQVQKIRQALNQSKSTFQKPEILAVEVG